MAVAALDDLVHELDSTRRLETAPNFLDWVADEATPLVEHCVERAFRNPRFSASLKVGDPRIAMARWVRNWVCLQIGIHFGDFVARLPEFFDGKPPGRPMASLDRYLPHRNGWRCRRAGWPEVPQRRHVLSELSIAGLAALRSFFYSYCGPWLLGFEPYQYLEKTWQWYLG